jgi:hypothetical protein
VVKCHERLGGLFKSYYREAASMAHRCPVKHAALQSSA